MEQCCSQSVIQAKMAINKPLEGIGPFSINMEIVRRRGGGEARRANRGGPECQEHRRRRSIKIKQKKAVGQGFLTSAIESLYYLIFRKPPHLQRHSFSALFRFNHSSGRENQSLQGSGGHCSVSKAQVLHLFFLSKGISSIFLQARKKCFIAIN